MGGRPGHNKGHIKYGGVSKGDKMSETSKEKMRKRKLENPIRYWLGRKRTMETKNKIKNTLIQKGIRPVTCLRKGAEHHCWKGGKSFEPYTIDWTETLRRSIKERDHYTCKLCGILQGDNTFDVHHVDYNKNNCSPSNLITLCSKCHGRTNFRREKWIKILREIIN